MAMGYKSPDKKKKANVKASSKKQFGDRGKYDANVVTAEVVPKLAGRLTHSNYYIRLDAAEKLGELAENGGDIEPARPALEKAAEDYCSEVQKAAQIALAAGPLVNTQSTMCTEEKISVIEPRPGNNSGVWMIPVKIKKATETDTKVDHDVAPKVWDLFKELEKTVGGGIAIEILQEASNGTVEVANGGRTIDLLTEVTHTIVASTDALQSVKAEYAFYQSDVQGKGMTLYTGKKFDERTEYMTVKPAGKSRDGAAIRAGIKRLEERNEPVKILIVVNRARPSGTNYSYGPKDTGEARKDAESRGIKVLAITTPVDNSVVQDKNIYYESLYGKNHAEFTSIEELPEIFEKFLRTFNPGKIESGEKINLVEELTKKLQSSDYYVRQYAALDLRDLAKSGRSIEWARTALIQMRNDYAIECRRAADEALKAFDESRSKQIKGENTDGNVDLHPSIKFRGFDLTLAEALRQSAVTRKKAFEKIIFIAHHGTTGMDYHTKLAVADKIGEITADKKLMSGIDGHVKSNIRKILTELSNDYDSGITTLSKIALDALDKA